MEQQFTSPQRVLLMDLMLMGGSATTAAFSSQPKPNDRKSLVEAKLIEAPKGTRGYSYSLTDAGWKWAEDHLTESYSMHGPAAKMLQKALSRLHEHLYSREIRLADFARPRKTVDSHARSNGEPARQSNGETDVTPNHPPPEINAAIESACLQLGGGAERQGLRLAELRRLLTGFDRQSQDAALLDLASAQSLVLYPMDDPREIEEEDRAAELRTPGGEARHIVYWIGAKARNQTELQRRE